MNHASPETSLAALLVVAVLLGTIAFMPASPTMGQVVIDMPPPPARDVPVKPERPDDEDADEDDDAEEEESDGAPPTPAVAAQPYVADDAGRLALSRYVGARYYARPHDPYWHWGYQPRGRGVGPRGLGHPCSWYGDFHVVAPAVFISGRGQNLFR